ncbi:imidazolonepropionase [candidate division KSB1 bacterium]
MKILIENISQLLTMDPSFHSSDNTDSELGIIENAALYIEDDLVHWLGSSNQIPETVHRDSSVFRVDAGMSVVMPGIIDSHTHLIFAGSREREFSARLRGDRYEDILAAGGGIHSTVRATRAAAPFQLLESGKKRLDFCLDHGVTTVEVKSGYGLETSTEIKMLEVARLLDKKHPVDIISTFLGAHVVPEEFKSDREGYISLMKAEMFPEIKERGLADFCDVFIEEGAFTVDEARKIITAGIENGLKPRLHVDQFNDTGGIECAVEFGAASVDHLEAVTADGIKMLADSGIPAVLLPGATFFLGLPGYAPARELILNGVTTALATDFNPGSCMTAMPFIIMTIASVQMKMMPAEVLTAFTVNAAQALGKNDRGVLGRGKRADVIILNVENYEMIPYFFAVNHVAWVIKNGLVVKGPGDYGAAERDLNEKV